MTHYKGVKSLKRLHYLANVFSVAPLYDFDQNRAIVSTLHKVYGLLGCIFTASFAIYCLIGRTYSTYPILHGVSILVDFFSLFIVTTTNIYLTLRLNLLQSKNFQTFIHLLVNFDAKSEISTSNDIRMGYCFRMALHHAFYFAFCFCDAWVWTQLKSLEDFIYYSNRYVQYYQLLTFCFLIYNYVLLIRDRFIHLNNLLVNHVTKMTSRIFVVSSPMEPLDFNQKARKWKNEEFCLKHITILYTSLCDIVKLFNLIFGKILLLMVITIVFCLLEPLNIIILTFKLDLEQFKHEGSFTGLVVACVLWALVFLMFAEMIIGPCQEATNEAQKTSYLSYKLIQTLSGENKQSASLKEDLTFLAHQSFEHSPFFHANGFYNIDHGLLGCIVTAVTSYLVVLIQLN